MFSERVSKEYDSTMELARAIGCNDLESASKFSRELENASTDCEQAAETYYRGRLASTKARKDFVLSVENDKYPIELFEIIMPIYDKEVWAAERQLSSFLNKKESV